MKKIIIFFTFAIATFITISVFKSTTLDAIPVKEYGGSIYENTNVDSYYNFINKENINRPNEEIEIDCLTNYTFVDDEFQEHVEEVEMEQINGLLIPETGEITYRVNVQTSGYYNIKIKYYTVTGRSANISKGIKINDKYQFAEAESFILSRIWQDEFDVSEKREDGKHDIKPTQIEKNRWSVETIRDTQGYYGTSYLFYFDEGENKITFVADREPVIFSTIYLFQEEEIKSYLDVFNLYQQNNYQPMDNGKITYKVQGESAYEKSSPSLTPQANYTSFKIEPYVKFLTRYNTIGGENWSVSGDWISWEIDVPESGLYQLTFKALQNFSRGLQTSRKLYVNGVVPFKECLNINFNYSSDWKNITLGDENGAYWFYLEKGKNDIRLENTIGSYGDTVRMVNEVVASLNWIYRKVIMRTGVNPSKYQDFQLEKNIPGLYKTIDESIDYLQRCIDNVIEISGSRSDLISSLERTQYQLKSFKQSEKKIQVGLDELEYNITALGTWVTTVSNQPLSIDYLVVHGKDAKLDNPGTNFFQKIWHEFILLIGSYGSDTSLKSSVEVDGPTIEVWIMTGRDQSNLLRQLIDESFTLQNNVNVVLKLVSGTVLLPATLSGNGPDVAIGVGQNIPVNWGIRNSVVDLTQFSDFEDYRQNFYDSAITPFTFNGATYALPDTQDFLIQFVRTDIFQELDLVDTDGKVVTPKSWNEVIDLLPILQRQYLDYYLPNVTGALSPLMFSMINQYGGSLYINDGAESGMMLKESSQAFYDFVNFYRNYGFAIDASFTNRFRTGEMPIGVSNYTLYNTLSVSAPEIRGNWEFSLLPGYLNDQNVLCDQTTSTSSATIILSQTKELEASWKFMKWWLGSQAQAAYARGMEAILGAAARYPTANKEAFAQLPWSAKDYRLLELQRSKAVGVPIVPGDYIVGRYIDNAFRKVINDNVNPSDSLFNYNQKINAELQRKRQEFNLK